MIKYLGIFWGEASGLRGPLAQERRVYFLMGHPMVSGQNEVGHLVPHVQVNEHK